MKVRSVLRNMTMVFVLIGLLIVFFVLCYFITGRNFLSPQNLLNILGQNANLLIIGVGITFIMLGGGMDLSTGYLVATVGIVMALMNGGGVGFVPTIVVGIILAIVISGINGAVYAWLKVFPFIITLAMQYILNGAAYLATGGVSRTFIGLSMGFTYLGGYGIKIGNGGATLKTGVLVAIVMIVIGAFILNRTRFGRNVYALGSNPDAVALSGVSVGRMRILVFALAGLFFGVSQVVYIGFMGGASGGSANNAMGVGTEFTVMAGCMLGGIKMGGGGGKMYNMVVGVMIIGILNSGMNFLNMNQYWKYVVLGIALLAAIMVDTLQSESVARRAKMVSGQDPSLEKKGQADESVETAEPSESAEAVETAETVDEIRQASGGGEPVEEVVKEPEEPAEEAGEEPSGES